MLREIQEKANEVLNETERAAFEIWYKERYGDYDEPATIREAFNNFEDSFFGLRDSEEEYAKEWYAECYHGHDGYKLIEETFSIYIDWRRVWIDEFCCNRGFQSALNPLGSGVFIFCYQD